MPGWWLFQYSPVKARSVPFLRRTPNCAGVNSFFHSSSVLLTLSFIFQLRVTAGELVDSAAPVAETVATRVWLQPASSNIETPRLKITHFISVARLESSPSSCLCNCGCGPLFSVAREVFHLTDHQRGPAGLMAGTQSLAGFAVEIFVEQNQVAPVRVFGPARFVAMERAAPVFIGQENTRESARQFL